MANLQPVTPWLLVRTVFLNVWGAVVGAVWAMLGVLDYLDGHVVPRHPKIKTTWEAIYVLPSFTWQTWVSLLAVGLLVLGLHGAYKFARNYWQRYSELVTARLEVIYDGDSDHLSKSSDGSQTFQQVIRLRIRNKSGNVITGVTAKVKRFLNFGDTPIFNVPLRVTHDRHHKKSGGFSINPDDSELVDLVETRPRDLSGEIYLTNGFDGEPYVLTVTRATSFIVTVIVSAAAGSSQEKDFEISLKKDGTLNCFPVS